MKYFYNFTKKRKEIKKLRYYKIIKEKYKNDNLQNKKILFIQLDNEKEWDIGFILYDNTKTCQLCLGQILIYQKINKI